ncbi:pseudouridylate synthase [Candidatus Acidianus copahuensis]|uniref:Pseudouridylate synthase n=2 Tax=Sulfolobaceae TaxID=118883 RepID=A0A031LP42_9CREN|nr:pseudouridylate synthase [Candidatus Acidianus copahuensis]
MELDRKIKDHEFGDLEELKDVFYNIGRDYSGVYENYFSDSFQNRSCYLCGSFIKEFEEDFFIKALSYLKESKVNYVLGVRLSDELREREREFAMENSLIYYESIKNEIRREVGKRLSAEGFPPCIDNADVEIVYDVETRQIYLVEKRRLNLYLYSRLSRRVTISSWYSDTSLEEGLKSKVMVPFVEPSEVRILDKYPIITERNEDSIEVSGYIMRKVREISGREIGVIMGMRPIKRVYRLLVYSTEPIGEKVYEKLYDVYVEARDFQELREKLSSIKGEVLLIDLVKSEGKHKSLESIS